MEVWSQRGLAAVAVEPLARRLGVTKGSFYWHFPNRAALIRAVLKDWEQSATEAVIQALDQLPDPRERLRRLYTLAYQRSLELAVFRAADDPLVAPVVRRVSARRIDYLVGCYRSLGLGPREARHRALLAYGGFLGYQYLTRHAPARLPPPRELAAFHQHVIRTLVP